MQGDRGKPTACFTWPEKLKKEKSRKLQAASSKLDSESRIM